MIREERQFLNSKTDRYEVWLHHHGGLWRVFERGDVEAASEYPDTDQGYYEARLDYGQRVTRRVWGEQPATRVYLWFTEATPEKTVLWIEDAENCEVRLSAQFDAPRARAFVRRLTHWLENGEMPENKTAEEWLFTRDYPTACNKARDAARRLFQALKAEWADRPDTHPLLAELVAEHPWIEKEPA